MKTGIQTLTCGFDNGVFAKILIFVHLMEMYDNTTKKLSENTTLIKYMSYVVTCDIYQPG
jgi:hypothetical protein